MLKLICTVSSETEFEEIVQALINRLGLPPVGDFQLKQQEGQRWVELDTNLNNTESLCYLASCHEEIENIRNGRTTAHTPESTFL